MMLFRKKGFPSEDELVMCKVTNIHINSVFVEILEYRIPGMIHISEVSPGRIRNIRDFVKIGKVVVCKVLRVNKERGHVDLSLRRVTETQRRAKVNEMKQEQKAEKIVEFVANKLNQDFKQLYYQIWDKISGDYEMLSHFFEDCVENDKLLNSLGLSKEVASFLKEEIRHRIKPPEVRISGIIKLTSYEPNGVEIIKEALKKAEAVGKNNISMSYAGGGKFKCAITAKDYKTAEKMLDRSITAATKYAEQHNTEAVFERDKS